jgi:rod shape-determining protein MreC
MTDGKADGKKNRRKETYVFFVLLAFSFTLILFSSKSFIINFRDTGATLFSGLRIGVDSVTSFINKTILSVEELANLRKEYDELLARMERYEFLERDQAELREENIRLREQLKFSTELNYKHTAAEITGRDPNNLYSIFSINKGKRAGVSVDMCVVAYQDGIESLAGKITSVNELESFVMPIYNENAFISARLKESRYEGIVEGRGSFLLPLFMRFTPKSARETLNKGELIITSGLGGVYPAGITIGRVRDILYDENATSMELSLSPMLDFSRLEYVFVLINEQTDEKEAQGGYD